MANKLEINLLLKAKQFFNEMNRFDQRIGRMAFSINQIEQSFQRFYAIVSKPFERILSYDTALKDVAKKTGISKLSDEFKELRKSQLDLTDDLPLTAVELAGIDAAAGQLGIRGVGNISKFREATAKSATALGQAADFMSTSFGKFANIFKVPIDEAQRLGDSINALENTTTADSGYIIDSITRIGDSGKHLNLNFADVAGISAAINQLGLSAEVGSSAMLKVLTEMKTRAGEIGAVLGVTGREFEEQFLNRGSAGLVDFLSKMKELPNTAVAVSEAFGNKVGMTRTMGGLIDNVDILEESITRSNQAFKDGTSINEEIKVAISDTASQWQLLMNKIDRFILDMSDDVIPILQDAIEILAVLFENTARGIKAIGAGKIALSALGAVLLVVALRFGLFSKAGWKAVSFVKAFNLALKTNPIMLAVTAIGLLTEAIGFFSQDADDASDSAEDFAEKLKRIGIEGEKANQIIAVRSRESLKEAKALAEEELEATKDKFEYTLAKINDEEAAKKRLAELDKDVQRVRGEAAAWEKMHGAESAAQFANTWSDKITSIENTRIILSSYIAGLQKVKDAEKAISDNEDVILGKKIIKKTIEEDNSGEAAASGSQKRAVTLPVIVGDVPLVELEAKINEAADYVAHFSDLEIELMRDGAEKMLALENQRHVALLNRIEKEKDASFDKDRALERAREMHEKRIGEIQKKHAKDRLSEIAKEVAETVNKYAGALSGIADVMGMAASNEKFEREQKAEEKREALRKEIEAEKAKADTELANGKITEKAHALRLKRIESREAEQSKKIEAEAKRRSQIEKDTAVVRATIATFESAVSAYNSLSVIPIVGPALGIAASLAALKFGFENVANIKAQKYADGGRIDGPTLAVMGEAGQREFISPEMTFEKKFDELAKSLFSPIFQISALAQQNNASASQALARVASDRVAAGDQRFDAAPLRQAQGDGNGGMNVYFMPVMRQGENESDYDLAERMTDFLNEKVSDSFGAAGKGIFTVDQIFEKVINT